MLSHLSNDALIATLKNLVFQERTALVALLAHLAEFDTRKLYADMRYPSLFAYCVRELGYSEQATAKRVYTARAVQKHPVILDMLRKAEINMSAVMILGPHLTEGNRSELLARVRGKSSREVEAIVAVLAPRREVADCIRRISPPNSSEPVVEPGFTGAPMDSPLIEPSAAPPTNLVPMDAIRKEAAQEIDVFAPGRVHFGFNGGAALLLKYERARELLRHKYPAGKMEDVLADALDALLEKKDPDRWMPGRKFENNRPSNHGRTITRFVKREVWKRDCGRCVFVGPDGALCGERGGLEYDHIIPYALGGRSDDPSNIRLLCRTHNQLMARRVFGEAARRSP